MKVIADPPGQLLWISPSLPGAVYDLTAARAHGLIDALTGAGVDCYAGKGYQGAGGATCVPFRGKRRNLSPAQRAVNAAHAAIRAVGEQAVATIKGWRLLRKLRCGTTWITTIVQAILTLHHATA